MKCEVTIMELKNTPYHKLIVDVETFPTASRIFSTPSLAMSELATAMFDILKKLESFQFSFMSTENATCTEYLKGLKEFTESVLYKKASRKQKKEEKYEETGAGKKKSKTDFPIASGWLALREQNEIFPIFAEMLTIAGGVKCFNEESQEFILKTAQIYYELIQAIAAHNNLVKNPLFVDSVKNIDFQTAKLRNTLAKLQKAEAILSNKVGQDVEPLSEIKLQDNALAFIHELESVTLQRLTFYEKESLVKKLQMVRLYITNIQEEIIKFYEGVHIEAHHKALGVIKEVLTKLNLEDNKQSLTLVQGMVVSSDKIIKQIHQKDLELKEEKFPEAQESKTGEETSVFTTGYYEVCQKRSQFYSQLNQALTNLVIKLADSIKLIADPTSITLLDFGRPLSTLVKTYRIMSGEQKEKVTAEVEMQSGQFWQQHKSSYQTESTLSALIHLLGDFDTAVPEKFAQEPNLLSFFFVQFKLLGNLSSYLNRARQKCFEFEMIPKDSSFFMPFSSEQGSIDFKNDAYLQGVDSESKSLSTYIEASDHPYAELLTKNYIQYKKTVYRIRQYISKIKQNPKYQNTDEVAIAGLYKELENDVKECLQELAQLRFLSLNILKTIQTHIAHVAYIEPSVKTFFEFLIQMETNFKEFDQIIITSLQKGKAVDTYTNIQTYWAQLKQSLKQQKVSAEPQTSRSSISSTVDIENGDAKNNGTEFPENSLSLSQQGSRNTPSLEDDTQIETQQDTPGGDTIPLEMKDNSTEVNNNPFSEDAPPPPDLETPTQIPATSVSTGLLTELKTVNLKPSSNVQANEKEKKEPLVKGTNLMGITLRPADEERMQAYNKVVTPDDDEDDTTSGFDDNDPVQTPGNTVSGTTSDIKNDQSSTKVGSSNNVTADTDIGATASNMPPPPPPLDSLTNSSSNSSSSSSSTSGDAMQMELEKLKQKKRTTPVINSTSPKISTSAPTPPPSIPGNPMVEAMSRGRGMLRAAPRTVAKPEEKKNQVENLNPKEYWNQTSTLSQGQPQPLRRQSTSTPLKPASSSSQNFSTAVTSSSTSTPPPLSAHARSQSALNLPSVGPSSTLGTPPPVSSRPSLVPSLSLRNLGSPSTVGSFSRTGPGRLPSFSPARTPPPPARGLTPNPTGDNN